MAEVHIGTSGYSYDDWAGRFYPKSLPPTEWLRFYATKFDTVELNVTFYRTPNNKTFEGWYRKTPDNFHFVIKGSRFITHIRRLQDPAEPLRIFFEAASPLQDKLKVVLWQLPPKFPADPLRLSRFLDTVSHVTNAFVRAKQLSPVRQAFEFRDRSWLTDEVYELLRSRSAALVFADHPFEITEPRTTDFLYIRRHGPGGRYHASYSREDLTQDAELIRRHNTLTYEFFNNDVRAVGALNALDLKAILGR